MEKFRGIYKSVRSVINGGLYSGTTQSPPWDGWAGGRSSSLRPRSMSTPSLRPVLPECFSSAPPQVVRVLDRLFLWCLYLPSTVCPAFPRFLNEQCFRPWDETRVSGLYRGLPSTQVCFEGDPLSPCYSRALLSESKVGPQKGNPRKDVCLLTSV